MAVPVQGISLLCLRLNPVELPQPVDGLMKSVINKIQQKKVPDEPWWLLFRNTINGGLRPGENHSGDRR